jgi:hypothetical protein
MMSTYYGRAGATQQPIETEITRRRDPAVSLHGLIFYFLLTVPSCDGRALCSIIDCGKQATADR